MEKRSRRRIRDLVARPASLGLSENEIGCARISMMARNTNVPFKGRIQKRKTYHLQIITFRLQRAAGPYRSAMYGRRPRCKRNLTYNLETQDAARSVLAGGVQGISPRWPGPPGASAMITGGSIAGRENFSARLGALEPCHYHGQHAAAARAQR
jgi:hypothetical protein